MITWFGLQWPFKGMYGEALAGICAELELQRLQDAYERQSDERKQAARKERERLWREYELSKRAYTWALDEVKGRHH